VVELAGLRFARSTLLVHTALQTAWRTPAISERMLLEDVTTGYVRTRREDYKKVMLKSDQNA
jgi:hypothetical protein